MTALAADTTDRRVLAETIAVASGKGGTGKTLILACLGYALLHAGHRVLFIDTDFATDGLSLFLLGPDGPQQVSVGMPGTLRNRFKEDASGFRGPIQTMTISRTEARDHGLAYEAIITGSDLYGMGSGDRDDVSAGPLLSREAFKDAISRLLTDAKQAGRWDYILVDTRGGFAPSTTDVCSLCDGFFVVTEPQSSSLAQNLKLVDRISEGVEARGGKKSLLRGIIVNKAEVASEPRAPDGEGLAEIVLDKLEVEYRTQLARLLNIDFEKETHPIPIDVEAVRAYKGQLVPYRTAPWCPFSFASLVAFGRLLRVVANQCQWNGHSNGPSFRTLCLPRCVIAIAECKQTKLSKPRSFESCLRFAPASDSLRKA
jgi:MinD-like ATPase involved in chromosome partitioning or flagellar assembly